MEAIHQFKYGGKRFLAKPFGTLLAKYAEEWIPRNNGLLIMPVPVHPKKLKEREFNQSLLLARPISTRLEGKLDFSSLRRIRNTLPQTGLKGAERRRNVLKAFALEKKSPVTGRTILLVDDVATTGNTLNECARVLIKGGAKEVLCLVLARTAKL
jgi:ComF family protein